MPPSRHSSTSHHSSSSRSSFSHSSSSHRSSSHSSSSHSSFSRSSFSGSSVSRHSSSSYKSSAPSYGHISGSGYRSAPVSTPTLPRPRYNQPQGYHVGKNNPTPKEYHCKKHDYVFYNTSWYSDHDGKYYKRGYYDETGKWYEDVLIKDVQTNEVRFVCPYCDTEVKAAWRIGEKPSCPNCSAQLQEIEADEIDNSRFSGAGRRFQSDPDLLTRIICFSILGLIVLGLGIPAVRQLREESPSETYSITATQSAPSSYFVEELGRSCPWDSYSESYYDSITDCYFWYNDEVDIPTWQYWYESISSDFGDYGWMEYDEYEGKWYIEADYGNWIELPDNYATDDLWYIHELYE